MTHFPPLWRASWQVLGHWTQSLFCNLSPKQDSESLSPTQDSESGREGGSA